MRIRGMIVDSRLAFVRRSVAASPLDVLNSPSASACSVSVIYDHAPSSLHGVMTMLIKTVSAIVSFGPFWLFGPMVSGRAKQCVSAARGAGAKLCQKNVAYGRNDEEGI